MKKVFLILATMLIMATLGACGSNTVNNSQTEEATTALDISTQEGQNEIDEDEGNADEESYMYQMTEQEIQAAIADYHGEYRCTADANSIVINDNGMYYDGAKLDIQSIGEGYVVLNNSNLIIILSAGTVSANFTHAEDNSYLDDYERIGGENVNHPDEQVADTDMEQTGLVVDENQSNQDTLDSQDLTDEKLMTYLGNYTNTSTSDTFSLVSYDGDNGCTYRADQIAVNDVTRTSPDRHASVFAAKEFDKNDDGNYYIRRSTMYGFCTITLLSDNQIYLKLECSDWSYEGTFSKQ